MQSFASKHSSLNSWVQRQCPVCSFCHQFLVSSWTSLFFISLQKDIGFIMSFFQKKNLAVSFPLLLPYRLFLVPHFYPPIRRPLSSSIPPAPSYWTPSSLTIYTHSNNPYYVYREMPKVRSHIWVRMCDNFCLSETGFPRLIEYVLILLIFCKFHDFLFLISWMKFQCVYMSCQIYRLWQGYLEADQQRQNHGETQIFTL